MGRRRADNGADGRKSRPIVPPSAAVLHTARDAAYKLKGHARVYMRERRTQVNTKRQSGWGGRAEAGGGGGAHQGSARASKPTGLRARMEQKRGKPEQPPPAARNTHTHAHTQQQPPPTTTARRGGECRGPVANGACWKGGVGLMRGGLLRAAALKTTTGARKLII